MGNGGEWKGQIGLMWIMDALSSEGVGLPHSYSWEGGLWVDGAWTDHLLTILCVIPGSRLSLCFLWGLEAGPGDIQSRHISALAF